ncbi:XRE family transcriptional regulator [Candidatus Poribacteria bacterium]|nr:MAG: XRE family transcriptional regulator [Candidatus Poribacteria bacterium]
MNFETVERNNQKFVLVPIEQYNQLLADIEMLKDVRDFRGAKAVDEETFPAEVINRLILNEENPIKVYREYRELTQKQLADKVGIQRTYLAEIETGRKSGSVKTLKAIAEALDVDLTSIL